MEKRDMILLIETEDEIDRMDEALDLLAGQGHGNGRFIKLDNVYDVIQHNSHPAYSGSEEADQVFHNTVTNRKLTPEERALILMNEPV